MSADDARAKIAAGADLVQIYTGLIYKGPALVTQAAMAVKDYRPLASSRLPGWTVTIESEVMRRDGSKYFHFTGLGCLLYWRM